MLVETLEKDPREDYFALSGEALCQYLLREDHEAMVLARGPMPFLSGNKVTIGYLSPLTDLPHYGIKISHQELMWFAQAFWAQSIDLKIKLGWRPPSAQDLPSRVFEALSLTLLEPPPEELRRLMDLLIDEWKRQAGGVMEKFGYEVIW